MMMRRVMRELLEMVAAVVKPGRKPVVCIIGTTGVGKSQLGVEIALKYGGEIINADSMQMYRGVELITNKHPVEEQFGVPHRVMGHVEWDEEYDMHRFARELLALIEDIHSRGKIPILVGGTHYYLQSALFVNKTVTTNANETNKMADSLEDLTVEQRKILTGPPDELIHELKKIDPVMGNKFHPNDYRRIKRSLEIYYRTNKPASQIYAEQNQSEESLRFETLFLWLYSDMETLSLRLDSRVDKMIEQGALDEIEQLAKYPGIHSGSGNTSENDSTSESPKSQDKDYTRGIWQVIGFKEFSDYLVSRSDQDLRKGIEVMKTHTRQYLKRQIKWIRNLLLKSVSTDKTPFFVMDATNLQKWPEVQTRLFTIMDQFLSQVPYTEPITTNPQHALLLTPTAHSQDNDRQAHQHIECSVCRDSKGSPLVVLSSQWQLHLQGSRHRRSSKQATKRANLRHPSHAKNDI